MGDYGPVNTNAIVKGAPASAAGIVTHSTQNSNMSNEGDIILSHKEFVQNIVITCGTNGQASSSFTNQTFPLNPGLQSTFPFLSQLAQNFTLYSMQGLMFQYKPTSGEMGVNSQQLGKIIMATDYDPDAQPFINSVQMENYQFSNSAKPSLGQVHGVECKPTQSLLDMKYIRTGKSTKDKALTDIGLFQLATEGIPFPSYVVEGTTLVVGELWATYTIKVSRANLYSSLLGFNVMIYCNRVLSYPYPGATSLPSLTFTNFVTTDVVPPTRLPNVLTEASNLSIQVDYYPPIKNSNTSPNHTLGACLVLTWPVNTILGTYKIKFIQSQNISNTLGQWMLSPANYQQTTTGGIIANSANKVTRFGCPFDSTATQPPPTKQIPLHAPSMDPLTGIPIFLSQGVELMRTYTESAVNITLAGSYIYSNFSGTQNPFANSLEFSFTINAPSLNRAQCVLEFVPSSMVAAGGSTDAPSTTTFNSNTNFLFDISSTNGQITGGAQTNVF